MLTLRNYDYAIIDYLKTFYDNVIWGSPSEAFRNAALADKDEKVKLPLISVYRTDLSLSESQNQALFRKGPILDYDDKEIQRERVLIFQLGYTVDLWAIDPDQASALFAELLFAILDDPGVPVKHEGIPYDIKNFIRITDIMENTDISYSDRGRLNRYTIVFQIQAHIAKLDTNPRVWIRPEFYPIEDPDTLSDTQFT